MATENPGVWGIDLGQCALKALRLENVNGQVTATAFDYVEHPKILSQPDADPDQLTREALEKFLSRNSLRGDVVAISIPGQSGLARFVKLPPVEEKKIGDIVRFEARQQIPFNLDEVVWDYQKIGSGMVTDGFALETEIGLFAIKRDTVFRYLQHFKDVNVEVHLIQMAPLALCNFVSFDLLGKTGMDGGEGGSGSKQSVVALDIGTDSSNLVITDGEKIIWQRPIPLGGNHFTRALTKDLKLTFAKAEHLKRNASKSPDLKKILSSLKPVLNDFVGEVQRSLGYFTNTHRDAQVQYMMGLGSAFRLPGLQKFLSEKLQLDVRKLTRLERLAGDTVITSPVYSENLLSFAVAYGLALQGLKLTHLQTNLLPVEIQTERMIRAKKPWAVSAAAALLLGTSALALGYGLQYRAVAAPAVKEAMEKGKGVVDKAARFLSAYQAEEKKIEEDKQGVRSIVAGQDERLNWIQAVRFIDYVLPLSDGSNLSPAAKEIYFDNEPAAQAAHKLFQQRQGGKVKPGEARGDDEEGVDRLINVNIENVMCMFMEDLSQYPTRLKGLADLDTMSARDKKAAPRGKGWVFELRGYTYHRDGRKFIVQTLIDNLQRLPIVKVPKPGENVVAANGETPMAPADGAKPPEASPKPGDVVKPAEAGKPGEEPMKAADAKPGEEPMKAAADAPAEGDMPMEGELPEDKPEDTRDPIGNRVSHAVLVKYYRDPNPEPQRFQLISSSFLSGVTGAGGGGFGGGFGGGGGAMSAGMLAPAGGSPSGGGSPAGDMGGGDMGGGGIGATVGGTALASWQPLLGSSGQFGGGLGGAMGMGSAMGMGGGMARGGFGQIGTGDGAARMPMPGGGGFMRSPMPGGPGSETGEDAEKLKKARHIRTEFVILFIWREPTPSDKLMAAPDDFGLPTDGSGGSMDMGMGSMP